MTDSPNGQALKPTVETWLPEARAMAAQCWCTPETSDIEMDSRLAEAVAWKIAAWMDTGAFHGRNEEYWRERALKAEAAPPSSPVQASEREAAPVQPINAAAQEKQALIRQEAKIRGKRLFDAMSGDYPEGVDDVGGVLWARLCNARLHLHELFGYIDVLTAAAPVQPDPVAQALRAICVVLESGFVVPPASREHKNAVAALAAAPVQAEPVAPRIWCRFVLDKFCHPEAHAAPPAGMVLTERWTPVSEQLPAEGVMVLVVLPNKHVWTAFHCERPASQWITNCETEDEHDMRPTHWMPLPAPPLGALSGGGVR